MLSFLILRNKLPKLISVTQLEQPFRQNRLDLRFLSMPCPELTSLLVPKIIVICGSTRVKLQDSPCSNLQLKLDTERWEDKFAGLLMINLMQIKYMTLISSITLNNLKISFVQLLSLNKCLLLEEKVEF